MGIRIASGILWFVVMIWAANFAAAFAGFPAGVAYLAAAGTATFIAVDPLKVLWPAQRRTVAPSPARQTDLHPAVQAGR